MGYKCYTTFGSWIRQCNLTVIVCQFTPKITCFAGLVIHIVYETETLSTVQYTDMTLVRGSFKNMHSQAYMCDCFINNSKTTGSIHVIICVMDLKDIAVNQ